MAADTQPAINQEQTLSNERLLQMYQQMLLARRIDEKAWALHFEGQIAFHISGMGQEACQVAAAHALRIGHDFVHAHYRDLALVLALGVTPTQFFYSLWGKQADVFSGGRQMPSHWSRRDLNLLSLSSPIANQLPQAAGVALAETIKRATGLTPKDEALRVTLVNIGEGAVSMGDWHEGLNWAAVHQLPLVCLVENNAYAISAPLEKQMAVKSVVDKAPAYGLEGISFNGSDVIESYNVIKYAIEKARAGKGPTLLEAKIERLKPPAPNAKTPDSPSQNDPIVRFEKYLTRRKILNAELQQQYNRQVNAEVEQAVETAQSAPLPEPQSALSGVYAN